MTKPLTVTRADKDVVADVLSEMILGNDVRAINAVARHRIASITELTEALRTISDDNCLDPWAVARAALAKAGGQ
jgi:hypothetical protein